MPDHPGRDEFRPRGWSNYGKRPLEERMPKLRLNLTMSLDGYVAGPDQSLESPLGRGGGDLHEWALATRSFRRTHGMEGGDTGLDDEIAAMWNENVGATIMGRNMFAPSRGPWGDDPWNGWWGEDPPFHTPVFVLTHHPREPQGMQGGTTFHFVTDGAEAALERALDAAGGKDVSVGGGAETAQQYLRARLVDEMEIHVVPLLLGGGSRLFENLDGGPSGYECVGLVSSPAVAHYSYVRADAA
jgi:dihydrofolate reductase